MKLGIVGLPNVGKSTLFNAITNAGAQSANYPFCTIEPNVGMVAVPDKRLDVLAKMYEPEKVTPAVIEFVDIAGLVKGASKGEGLGNKFLGNIRETDAIVHVVRCFDDGEIIHVDGSVDPKRDIDTINLELIFADIEMLQRRLERTQKAAKGDKKLLTEVDMLEKLIAYMNEGKSARGFGLTDDQIDLLKDTPLLSLKPVIYAANLDEKTLTSGEPYNSYYQEVKKIAESEDAKIMPICAKTEAEIAELGDEDKAMFLTELGLKESGLDRMITACYDLLGLISFLTSGKDECRAWTIKKGTKAPQAAGKIHTDLERGFIRAEVVSFDDLVSCGSIAAAKEKGIYRSEGKDYIVKDGDVVLIRFNV